jgi:hypothetical protein
MEMVVGEVAAADERVVSKHLWRLAVLIENVFVSCSSPPASSVPFPHACVSSVIRFSLL